MDASSEAIQLILHGCALAKDLESNLPTLANQPNFLSSSCKQIIRVFNKAMDLLNTPHPSPYSHMIFSEPPESWRPTSTEAMDLLHAHALVGRNPFDVHMFSAPKIGVANDLDLGLEITTSGVDLELGQPMEYAAAGDVEASVRSRSTGEFQATDTSDSGRSSSMGGALVQRTGNRRENRSIRKERVSAPRAGNPEIPPDDGFTWRKYGQKDILNSRFPRSYYRCTHKNFYGCQAKKYLQRLDDDPYTFEVTYRGHHTCQYSASPLILGPPASQEAMHGTTQPQPVSTSIQLGLSHVLMQRDPHVGSSHVQGGKDTETVVDLADAMFNSGSSSSSMDAIFSSRQEN
ncbi:WRKY transcription factor 55 [Magnolia sinica]|uniref:WRKY transcription factor 55 n=1 Tax=Magnolia sinica TaxID=86752 RepID=UPI0026583F8D|nr:WRKY transcription factor 55 [Magnolia sinica]